MKCCAKGVQAGLQKSVKENVTAEARGRDRFREGGPSREGPRGKGRRSRKRRGEKRSRQLSKKSDALTD